MSDSNNKKEISKSIILGSIFIAIALILVCGMGIDMIASNTDPQGNLLTNVTDLPIHQDESLNQYVRNLGSDITPPTNLGHLNPTYGSNMNIDGAFGGSPDIIYKNNLGLPNEWNSTAISGTWDTASTTVLHNGNFSVDATLVTDGSILQFNNGGILTNYSAITGYIYITKWSEVKNNHLEMYGYDTVGGVMVGNSIDIEDYIDADDQLTWLKFTVPLSDLGITNLTADGIRFEVFADIGEPNAPDFYFADIQIEESGGAIEFIATPIPGTWYYATHYKVIMCDDFDSRVTGSSIPNINYNGFLGIDQVENGVINIIFINNQTIESFRITNILDYMYITESSIDDIFFDGNNTMFTMTVTLSQPLVLKYENGDRSILTINDDFSSLECFRVNLGGYLEFKS